MEKTTFEVRLGGGCIVETTADMAAWAQQVRDLHKSLTEDLHTFKPGDIVVHKDYLRLTRSTGMMVILEVLDPPIIAMREEGETPSNPYMGRKLDVRAVHLDEEAEKAFAHLYEARRFRPVTEEELASEEGQKIQKFSEELMKFEKFQFGDILVPKTGCSVRKDLGLLLFLGYEEHPIRNTECGGGSSQDGEIYDAHVCAFDGENYEDIRLPAWTLKLWDGAEIKKGDVADDDDDDDDPSNPLMAMMAAGLMDRLRK